MRLLFVLLAFAPTLASAGYIHVVSFDDPHAGAWVEDGVTIMPVSEWSPAATNGIGHMDSSHVPFSKWLDFTTGNLFTPMSVEVMPGGIAICGIKEEFVRGEPCTQGSIYPYMSFSGFLNDALVSSVRLYQANEFALSLSILGTIDKLRIETLYPWEVGLANQCWADPCSHFGIDNVKLQSVPEPESFGLLAIGLLGALLSRRRGRRNQSR